MTEVQAVHGTGFRKVTHLILCREAVRSKMPGTGEVLAVGFKVISLSTHTEITSEVHGKRQARRTKVHYLRKR